MTRYLVVDDERQARVMLRGLIRLIDPEAEVHEADRGEEAIRQFEKHQPQVALVDIRMPGIGGMELAYHLSAADHPPAVIFITSRDEHAVRAFDANAIDYLLKPIHLEQLQRAINRARPLTKRQSSVLKKGEEPRTRVAVRQQGRLKLVSVDEIFYLRAENKYVMARTRDAEHLLHETLGQLEQDLAEHFIRAHRNALVNTRLLGGMEKAGKDRWLIFFAGLDEKLKISRRQKPLIRNWLRNRK